ncbi:MAG: acyl-ACP--UDP-N-acetylglucosamine O-acyltransferase [Chitinophagaceae bacterium]|nr:acyl-ACP--UDP-N-acetylglucosamine O-acyltransferase [Chitinophagaceae bacterium]
MISPLAHIHPDAKIGNNVTIDPFAVINNNVTIGDDTHIMSNAVIASGTTIGKSCKIFPGAVIGAIPQDLKFVGEDTTVEIGDHTTLRECVTVNRGTKDRWKTVVGSHCLLMAYAHVAHDCILGNYVILANGVQLAGHVTVDDHAILGGLAGVHQFTRVGAHTYVAGHTVIRKDVPPYVKAAREPLSYMGINIVGLQRSKMPKETIAEISNIYHILFVEKHTTSAALALIEKNFDSSPVKEQIVQFINTSRTGIIKRHSKIGNDDDFSF